jgi:hypothetical protein
MSQTESAIESLIHEVREHKVMLDYDLARLYAVETKMLNRAVRRNIRRFPGDFYFVLSREEFNFLKCQSGTSKNGVSGRGGRRYLPGVFTEHGVIMAANVLKSRRAVEISVFVVRAFVRIRQALFVHKELAHKLSELERRVGGHDSVIRELVSAIRRLAEPPPSPPRRRIGFHAPGEEGE